MAAQLARWPALAVLTAVSLAAIYRFAPSRRMAKWRWVAPGAIAATVLWLAGSALFSRYVAHFASAEDTFGTLGIMLLLAELVLPRGTPAGADLQATQG